jgi:cation diffusion facilitator CzcD-associated flavoprotein CzcO
MDTSLDGHPLPASAAEAYPSASEVEHLDVLVVGAGISGIGAAWHLSTRRPDTRFAVLESQSGFGGTWAKHRFPGIRSDSDLFTFGYRFKPWRRAPIGTADEILHYLGETIEENQLARHIRYGHRVLGAQWSSTQRRWQVNVQRGSERFLITAGFLWMCQGYYRHDEGYTPDWPGKADFRGRIVHPQHWPQDLDLTGQRVVVIGSGATAATLVPAIAGTCASLTMLQRTPTWFRCGREIDILVNMLRELKIPDEWVHEIARRKVLLEQGRFAQRCKTDPQTVAQELLAPVRARLGPNREDEVQRHFQPSYRPWQQRVAFLPEADLIQAVANGQVRMVTDTIERFDAQGIVLTSGERLDADVVISATGFHLSPLGDIPFSVDGRPVTLSDTVTWRGAMFSGLPNLVWVFGYIRASWTLRVDLLADFVLRLLDHMQAQGATSVTPQLRPQDTGMPLKPWIDPEDFNPGYMARGMDRFPKQGDRAPWLHGNDYWADKDELPAAPLDDGTLRFD